MAVARKEYVVENEVGVYHCISRCVRRAFLCGEDFYSGKNYEHRRGWIRKRLKELSEIFGIEVFSYAVMSNHLHVVIRNRPDSVGEWSDEEIVRRWCRLFPCGRDEAGNPLEPIAGYVKEFLSDAVRLKECRSRLSNISWFMRCLNEPIARRANKEDGCTGRFWEGRFKSQPLLDEGAILACMAYVDLNPVRAEMATGLEDSVFTSIYDRLEAKKAEERLAAAQKETVIQVELTEMQKRCIEEERVKQEDAKWLVGFGSESSPFGGDLSLEQYISLVEWTGQNIRADKVGYLPADLKPLLNRYDLDTERWVNNVADYGSLFYKIAGKVEQICNYAKKQGQKFFCGYQGSAQLYCSSA
jgi:REP element-mobilizing transposase RayT